MYETYCKTLFAVCTEEDFYQKIMRAISKRNSIINKYQIVYEVVSSAYNAPDGKGKDTLLSIPLPT